jgi:hypothetical protein
MKTFSQLIADTLQAEAIKDAMSYDMPSAAFDAMSKAYNDLLDSVEEHVDDLRELEDRQAVCTLLYTVRYQEIKEDFSLKNR